MRTIKILIVDDEPLLGAPLQRTLEGAGYLVTLAQSGAEALEAIDADNYDILLEDIRLPDVDGLDIMTEALNRMPLCRALVMTGHGSIENAVEAMKRGAVDFLTKPFSMDDLFRKLRQIMELDTMEDELTIFSAQDKNSCRIITRSQLMQNTLHTAIAVAATDSSVFLNGESGTGKELLADIIHANSPRRAKPCVKVNCAAIPENLFESELFGVERGAYTGADKSRGGYLDEADGGTLFLDEIAELPLRLQVKFLRALDEQKFYKVGSSKVKQVDSRPIAATNRNLLEMVETGDFREDLYYRINVVPITIPPLRERREDIPLLIAHFQKSLQHVNPGRRPHFTPEALEMLTTYSYPGNIRELRNFLWQLITLTGPRLDFEFDLWLGHLMEHASGNGHGHGNGHAAGKEAKQ